MAKGREVKQPMKLLAVADAVAHTGFANLLHSVLDPIKRDWEVHVLGINYMGDPHPYPYAIYPASLGGDVYGFNRLPQLLDAIQPDIVFLINDPWILKDYIPVIKQRNIPCVVYTPVDSPNIKSDFATPLNDVNRVIGYTQFAVDELVKAGLTSKTSVVPHGADITLFRPMSKQEAREKLGLKQDWFVVGNLNRNQPRKRIDLMLEYFAEWWKSIDKPDHVRLYWHGALQDLGYDVIQLAKYFGIEQQLIITSPKITAGQGVPKDFLPYIYNSFDVQMTTTLGEGWGFSQAEGAACRIPQIVPKWSGLAEWMEGAAHFVDCTTICVNSGGVNTIGGVADKKQFIDALQRLYEDEKYRRTLAQKAYALISQPRFRWETIAKQFDTIFREVIHEHHSST